MRYRFRFSIGHVMGLIGISALLMANALLVSQGNFTFYTVSGIPARRVGVRNPHPIQAVARSATEAPASGQWRCSPG
jgi:hypothetical protein